MHLGRSKFSFRLRRATKNASRQVKICVAPARNTRSDCFRCAGPQKTRLRTSKVAFCRGGCYPFVTSPHRPFSMLWCLVACLRCLVVCRTCWSLYCFGWASLSWRQSHLEAVGIDIWQTQCDPISVDCFTNMHVLFWLLFSFQSMPLAIDLQTQCEPSSVDCFRNMHVLFWLCFFLTVLETLTLAFFPSMRFAAMATMTLC